MISTCSLTLMQVWPHIDGDRARAGRAKALRLELLGPALRLAATRIELDISQDEANATLSHLVEVITSRAAHEVVVLRHGEPVARLVPAVAQPTVRLGVARGRFVVPASIDQSNEELLALFEDSTRAPAP